jgi:hypothetical protein
MSRQTLTPDPLGNPASPAPQPAYHPPRPGEIVRCRPISSRAASAFACPSQASRRWSRGPRTSSRRIAICLQARLHSTVGRNNRIARKTFAPHVSVHPETPARRSFDPMLVVLEKPSHAGCVAWIARSRLSPQHEGLYRLDSCSTSRDTSLEDGPPDVLFSRSARPSQRWFSGEAAKGLAVIISKVPLSWIEPGTGERSEPGGGRWRGPSPPSPPMRFAGGSFSAVRRPDRSSSVAAKASGHLRQKSSPSPGTLRLDDQRFHHQPLNEGYATSLEDGLRWKTAS